MKRILGLAISAVMILLSFTGCYYYGAGVDNMLIPPKLTDGQNEIYEALQKTVGSNINLRYPKTGKYRSAFITENIDEEPTKEAIVFYQKNVNTANPSALTVSILDQKDGEWVSIYDLPANGSDVRQVDFCDFGVADSRFIIVGYTMTSDLDNVMHIYRYQNNQMKDLYSQPYSQMEIVDINDDGYEEIVAITNSTGGQNAQYGDAKANVIKYKNGSFEVIDSVGVDASVTSYINTQSGFVGNNTTALYLDGLKGKDKMSTQILYYKDGTLKNFAFQDKDVNETMIRQTGITSMDIDGDGIVEIPVLEAMPGYDQTNANKETASDVAGTSEVLYFTHWNIFRDEKLEEKKISYVNMSFGYSFDIPEILLGKITAKRMIENNEIVFYLFENSLEESIEELFRIKVANVKEEEPEYERIVTNGQLGFYVKISQLEEEDNQVDLEMIREGFTLIKR